MPKKREKGILVFTDSFKSFASFFSFSPLVGFLFSYLTGLIFGFYWRPAIAILFALSGINLIIALWCWLKKKIRLLNFTIILGFFLLGLLALSFYLSPRFSPDHISHWPQNHPITIEGFLYRPAEYLPQKTRLYVKAQWVIVAHKKYPVFGNILLTVEDHQEKFLLFDQIIFSTRLRKPRNFGNPGGFNYVRWLAFQKIYVTGYVSKKQGLVRLGKPYRQSWLRKIDSFRHKFRETINASALPPANYFLRAVLLGERGVIPEEINETFARTGTAHILAISGLHIGIVAVLSYRLFRWFFSRSEYLLLAINVPKFSAFLSLFPIFFYSLIAGMGVSVQRALIMAGAYIIALLLNREKNLYQTIALAAFLILVFNPPALFEVSFQLSFVSVLGIVFFAPKLLSFFVFPKNSLSEKTTAPWWEKLKQQLLMVTVATLSATLTTSPLTARYFHMISFSGVIANLLIVPLVGFLVVVIGLAGIFFTFFSPVIAGGLFSIAGFLANLSIKLTNLISNLPIAALLVPPPSIATVFFFYLFIFSFFWWKLYHQAKLIFFVSLGGLLITSFYYPCRNLFSQKLKVVFIDVGQGDSTLVCFPGGKTMLIDGGGFPNQDFDTGKNIVAPLLLNQGVRRIDFLVLTHPHPDHYRGLKFIAKNFSIGEYWSNGDEVEEPPFRDLQKILVKRKIKTKVLNYNHPPILIDRGIKIEILYPPPHSGKTKRVTDSLLNNNSLVMRIGYKNIHFLFCGDIEKNAEEKILARKRELSSQVIKVAHHGSLTSSSFAFVDKVNPQIAICSVGFNNLFKLPHPQVIQRFQSRGCKIFQTDQVGAIFITTNGNNLAVKTFSNNQCLGL